MKPATLDNGVSFSRAAASANAVFHLAAGAEPVWDALANAAQAAWLAVVRDAALAADEGGEVGAAAFAARLYEAFTRSLTKSEPATAFDALPPSGRFAWEAVGRHLCQLLEADEVEDLAGAEKTWRGWAATRAAKEQRHE